ncbi:biotin carboxylase N-terminal domain-containing protein [Pseudomonas putida]|uniref:biotin carboxylase N-terminal domain-containing protein n=1 Tax=Pseudomonas putida TaxID=303 RepID=UPI003B227BA7
MYARLADEVHHLPGTSPAQTYLNQKAIIELAKASGAEAIHPGYGLLSENAEFAQAVQDAGLVWIGPSASAITLLGNKVAARNVAREAGAPLLPSVEDGNLTAAQAGVCLFLWFPGDHQSSERRRWTRYAHRPKL